MAEENKVKKLITNLKEQLRQGIKYDIDMDRASWGYEEGVLITGNEAKLLIELLKNQTGKKQ